MNETITKIKLDSKPKARSPIIISYTRDSDVGLEEITINGHEQPSIDLVDLMNGYLDLVISACRLDEKEWQAIAAQDDAAVIGLSIKRSESGDALGINLTAVGKFANDDETVSCVVINSPHIATENLSNADQFALERIETEAQNYLKGKRAQLSLIPTLSEVSA